jgi:hypothetical protein
VFRQGHLIAVVDTFLVGCAVLVVVGCAGGRSDRTEATQEQARSPEATASEEARCEKTRTFHRKRVSEKGGRTRPRAAMRGPRPL